MSDTFASNQETIAREAAGPASLSRPEPAGAVPVGLPVTRGRFGDLLAPLTLSSFRDVVSEVEQKLRIVNQTLSMLELDTRSFERILQEMLGSITAKTRELLGADRATNFLLDAERNELWSILADGTDGQPLELRIPADQGIAGEAASTGRVINIPRDFYDDPRSAFAQVQDRRNGYRTHSMLTLPLLDGDRRLVAVVQLMNKLVPGAAPGGPEEQLDPVGFSAVDEALFAEFSPTIRLILESSRSFYRATQKQRAAAALMQAIQSLGQSSLDLRATLQRVMHEARQLLHADRATLWLIDRATDELWTRLPSSDGESHELRIPIGTGFAGLVARTGQPLNIGFDLYKDPRAETARRTDQSTGYRTCSLLCLPVLDADGELIAVTQLVNKTRPGEFPAYDPALWPEAPECWRASFDQADLEFMQAFNTQAGVALHNARLFATVQQQEQTQRDILRSLSNGVISTDPAGRVIAANDRARVLLGRPEQNLEGLVVTDLCRVKEGDFGQWLWAALRGRETRDRQQYYPEQTVFAGPNEYSVNLSVGAITRADDASAVCGALVVLEDISDEKRIKSTLYRYMTQELAEQLLKGGDTRLGGDRRDVTVLFSDIRGYTTLTESMEAEAVVAMLNQYFESMVDAVFRHKGTLDKYIGDAIMAVFGSPLPLEDHAWLAVQTAVEMRHRLVELNQTRALAGQPPIAIGIGINSDSVISGNIGSSKRMEFTAIGDGVNLGSRLESACKTYGCDIVLSESTYRPCADRLIVRELDCIKVKGKSRPVIIYELVALREGPLARAIPERKAGVMEAYAQGRRHYLNRQFALAIGQFAQALELDRSDLASGLHLRRCQHWLQEPPPESWDGSWQMQEK